MNDLGSNRSYARVLVVDDSAFMRAAISRMIASDPRFEVAGTASGGFEALEKIPWLDPDIVTLDLQMPGLDGYETLRRIMHQFPRPVIIVSGTTERQAEVTLQALSLGAFDYVSKQLSPATLEICQIRDELVAKLGAAAESRMPQASAVIRQRLCQSSSLSDGAFPFVAPEVVAIAASTGGPKALEQVLSCLPHDFSVPVLIVQHMPIGFTQAFARRLNSTCKVLVHEAVHCETVRPGVVYVAPAGTHMTVERQGDSRVLIALGAQPFHCVHVPSADVMMKSVAEAFGDRTLGIILTGMGTDGAEGMKAIHLRGGITVGQDEATCVVYGMPRACAELGVLSRSVPLSKIPDQILEAIRYRKPA